MCDVEGNQSDLDSRLAEQKRAEVAREVPSTAPRFAARCLSVKPSLYQF